MSDKGDKRTKAGPGKSTAAGREILQGLAEVRDALKAGKVVGEGMTARSIIVDLEPKEYAGADVKAVREAVGASQAIFAKLVGADIGTVQSWEQGKRTPSPMARRFLDEIAARPAYFRKRIRDAIRPAP